MKISVSEMKLIPVNDLVPYQNNARTHSPEQINKIRSSLREFGFVNPILIDKNNNVIAGHGRLIGAKAEGYTEVPCVYVENLTEAQKKAYIIADNRMAMDAGWDDELLKVELESLKELNFDLSFTGFEEDELNDILGLEEDTAEVEEVDVPDAPEEAVTLPGQIFKLGDHYLMCGDSTKQEDVEKLVGKSKMDLLFTDPPYNVNISNSQGMTIENDNMDEHEFNEFLTKAFEQASNCLKKGGAFYIWFADSEDLAFRNACKANKLEIKQCLIWVKNGFNFGRQDYKWQHEPCLYGWKDGDAHYFVDEYNHSTVIEDKIDINKLKKEELKALVQELLAQPTATSVIHADKPIINDLHPTMKPLKMCAELIRHSTKKNEKVLDLFGGSGSTLVTCEQLNRKCYTMELDPIYCDVIIQRWENLTGKKAELIS